MVSLSNPTSTLLSPQTPAFSYTCLDINVGELRTIRIQPGGDNEPISCILSHQPPADYVCLSYTWGPPPANRFIYINHKRFLVRQSLHDFLKAARCYGLTDISLWIDAICINQIDNIEKSQQVSRMGEIYSLADYVIVWFGLDAINDEDALTIHSIYDVTDRAGRAAYHYRDQLSGRTTEMAWENLPRPVRTKVLETVIFDLEGMNGNPDLDGTKEDLRRLATHSVLGKLLSAEYWTRAWIVQEVVLAKSLQLLGPGGSHIDFWTLFPLLVAYLQEVPSSNKVTFQPLVFTWLFEEFEQGSTIKGGKQLEWALEITDASLKGCQDKRDRIYSVLSFVKDATAIKNGFCIDYDKGLEWVFWDAIAFEGRNEIIDNRKKKENGRLRDQCIIAEAVFRCLELSPPQDVKSMQNIRKLHQEWEKLDKRGYWISDYDEHNTQSPFNASVAPKLGICIPCQEDGIKGFLAWPVTQCSGEVYDSVGKEIKGHNWVLNEDEVTIWKEESHQWRRRRQRYDDFLR